MRKAATSDEQVSKGIRKLLQTSFPPHMNTPGKLVEYKQNTAIGGEKERERERDGGRERERERERD